MRLKDDEVRVLQGLSSDSAIKAVTASRCEAILKRFLYHGITDRAGTLTKRGRHVAAKLPPATEPLEEITEFEEWD